MSGVEVAGLILGAVPLIVGGLQHYSKGVSTIRIICGYAAQFRDLARQLDVERCTFQYTIEKLLVDCLDDEMLQGLLIDVGGKAWSEPHINEALRRK